MKYISRGFKSVEFDRSEVRCSTLEMINIPLVWTRQVDIRLTQFPRKHRANTVRLLS